METLGNLHYWFAIENTLSPYVVSIRWENPTAVVVGASMLGI